MKRIYLSLLPFMCTIGLSASSAVGDSLAEGRSSTARTVTHGTFEPAGNDMEYYAQKNDILSVFRRLKSGDKTVLNDWVALSRLQHTRWQFEYYEKGLHRDEWESYRKSLK